MVVWIKNVTHPGPELNRSEVDNSNGRENLA